MTRNPIAKAVRKLRPKVKPGKKNVRLDAAKDKMKGYIADETSEAVSRRLRLLAMDCAAGLVFTDRHCHSEQDFNTSFMCVSLLTDEQRKELGEKVKPQGMIYEYMSAALKLFAVNGLPVFASFRYVISAEAKEFMKYWAEENARRAELYKGSPKP